MLLGVVGGQTGGDRMEVQEKRKRDDDDEGDQDDQREESKGYGGASSSVGVLGQVEIVTNDEDEMGYEGMTAWDDVKDGPLDPRAVYEARMEEIDFMKKEGVYEKVPVEECRRVKGGNPTSVRWIDTDKGHGWNSNIRCRLVARDFKVKGDDRDDIFASMPPLEAKKVLVAKVAERYGQWKDGKVERCGS